MTNVIVAFATEEQCARCAAALEASGIAVSWRCTSFSGVKRAFTLCGDGVLVSACRLPDGTVDDLAWDLGERAIVVAVGKAAQLENCEHPKLFRLRVPCSQGELASAVDMLMQLMRMRQPQRSEAEKQTVAKAKARSRSPCMSRCTRTAGTPCASWTRCGTRRTMTRCGWSASP